MYVYVLQMRIFVLQMYEYALEMFVYVFQCQTEQRWTPGARSPLALETFQWGKAPPPSAAPPPCSPNCTLPCSFHMSTSIHLLSLCEPGSQAESLTSPCKWLGHIRHSEVFLQLVELPVLPVVELQLPPHHNRHSHRHRSLTSQTENKLYCRTFDCCQISHTPVLLQNYIVDIYSCNSSVQKQDGYSHQTAALNV